MLTKHLRGFPVQKKCARLPPNTAHACARLTLVCAHASNHGSGPVETTRRHVAGPSMQLHNRPMHLGTIRSACIGTVRGYHWRRVHSSVFR